MYSFYGGQPGYSFVIITTYRSIADMITCFQQGPDYTAVHFDQHVMINTVNKNDPDNGKIYRRGYDFNNEMGGAEFVGIIVGPAGKAPMLQMTTIADVQEKTAEEGFEERHSSGSYTPAENNLVPGKTIDGDFNDSINWACYSIRNENNEDTTAYIGFTFPYPVIDIEASGIDPYFNGVYIDRSSATRIDDYKHPFYEKWHLDIPKGIKGDSVKNLQVQIADNTIEPYENQAEDISNQRQVLVYECNSYDNKEIGTSKKFYVGDYDVIKDISIAEDGTITIQYTHKEDNVFQKKIKWIKSLSLNENGTFTIYYNDGTKGTTTDEIPETQVEKVKWVTKISSPNGKIVNFHYNTGDDDTIELDMDYGKGVTIDTSLTWRGTGTESYAAGMITESLSGINNFFKKRVIIKNNTLNRLPSHLESQDEQKKYQGLAPGYLTKKGIFQPSTVYWTTDFIPLFNDSKEFDEYPQEGFFMPYVFCYLNAENGLIEKQIKEMIFYDINYKYIDWQYHPNNENVKASDFIANGGGLKKYVRFSFQKTDNQDWSNLMFLIDGKVYSADDKNHGRIPNLAAGIDYYIENTNVEKSSFGTNYKIAVFGDGIVGGAYNDNKSYVTMTCEQLGITCDLHFFGGKCLANGIQTQNDGTSGDSTNIQGLASDIQYNWLRELQNNSYDLIYIATTSNDWYYTGLPSHPNVTYELGTMTDQTYNTFYGAMHKLCQTMKYVKAPVVFATPLKKWIDKTGQGQQYEQIDGKLNYQSQELNLWREAVLRVCEYHGFPVFDLYKESFFTPWVLYDRQTYTVAVNDKFGTHPNNAGHEKIARRFKGILREYLPFV